MKKINIIGNIFGSDGYTSHTRQLAAALYKIADCRITTQVVPGWERLVNDAELDMITKPDRDSDINLIITTPHNWRLFTGLGINLAYCIWEGDKVPESYIQEFLNPNIDYILVPSNHTKEAILNTISKMKELGEIKISKKIKIIPHGVDSSIFNSQQNESENQKLDESADTFKFVCNKGWRGTSWDRGGVQYLLKAFAEEFGKDEKVELIVKLNPAYINQETLAQSMNALNLPQDKPKINICLDNLPFDKLAKLYHDADCFICPTRCESFGLCGLEAMSCGLPTIQTNFGGQIDYMTAGNSMYINYELSESEEKPLYENIRWAIPDIKHLKEQMRWAFEHQDMIKVMSKIALEDSKKWSWDNSAQKIIEIL